MLITKNIPYAPPQPETSQGHLLDLYLPEGISAPAPLVIWSCGSAWMAENGREGASIVAAALVPRGYAVAGVSIRSSASAIFPAQLYDIKAAIRWLRAHAAEYSLDTHHFGIMGDSSGGWTAAMAGVTGGLPQLRGEVGETGPSGRVQAVVTFYPPTDFLQMDAHMIEGGASFNQAVGITGGHADPRSPESLLLGCPIESCPEVVKRASPLTYASVECPPFLIMHGTHDLLVPYHQGLLLYEALSGCGSEVSLVTVPGGEHGQWQAFLEDPAASAGALLRQSKEGLALPDRPVKLSWDTVCDFFDKHLR